MIQKLTLDHINHWLADHYGSRRGFLLTWWHRLLYHAGRYRQLKQVDWDSVERLVFVCKGNVCRSAFAEVVARSKGISSTSCGIEAGVDVSANSIAITEADARGYCLKEHRTMPLSKLKLQKNDLLIAMEPWQAEYLKEKFGGIYMYTLLGIWGGSPHPYLHDPYGASVAYFNVCFNCIENFVDEIIKKTS